MTGTTSTTAVDATSVAPAISCDIDTSGTVRSVSAAFTAALGWSAVDVVGTSAPLLVHPEDQERLVRQAIAFFRDDGDFDPVWRLRNSSGDHLWYRAEASAVRDSAGAVTGVRVTLVDVRDMIARETEYRLLAEHAGDIVFRATLDGVYEWVSPSVLPVLGYRPDEIVGRRLEEFLHPGDAEVRDSAIAGAGNDGTIRYVGRIRHKDGGFRWISVVGRALLDERGRPLARVGSARAVDDEVEARQALMAREAEYRLLAENAADVVFRTSPSGGWEYLSPAGEQVLGYAPEQLLGHQPTELIHPDDLGRLSAAMASVDSRQPVSYEARFRRAGGGYAWLGLSVRPVVDRDGQVVARVGNATDVGDAVAARTALQSSEAMFRSVMQSSTVGMAVLGLDLSFRAVNQALCDLVQYEEAWFLQHFAWEMSHPDDLERAQSDPVPAFGADGDPQNDVLRLVRSDGASVWVRRISVLVRDPAGRPLHLVTQLLDLTAERDLEFQTFHDVLTGLRNRTWILDNLDEELRIARHSGGRVGVLFVDLDNFKVVNDSLGHAAGDEVLAKVAQRLLGSLRPGDHIGRFGGDEFVVVVRELDEDSDLERACERMLDDITRPLEVQGHNVTPTASIGIAVSTSDSTAQSLLRDADSALYRAKSAGKQRWHFADEAMHAQAIARLTTEDELRGALARHELVVHYQPIVRLDTREVVAHEALVRWQHPERGLVPPLDFLPVAEESGLIVDIGDQVLDMVCRMLASRPDLASVSVNLSPLQISRAGWRERFVATLLEHSVDPRRITVEVTETAVLDNLDDAAAELESLRELGVGVHVDDFGTGFSSLALLRDLPISGIKLDMSFTRRITGDGGTTEVLAQGLARLGESLGLVGIAEGVETEEQARILATQGWSRGQGWLFGRPQPEPFLG